MHTATNETTRSARSRKANGRLSTELKALIDEAAELDRDEQFQEKRRREETLRRKLKDKLGVGTHSGVKYVLTISYGTPQQRFDQAGFEVDLPELFNKVFA